MIALNAPGPSPISFGAVKRLFRAIDIDPLIRDEELAGSMRLIFPLDPVLAETVRSGASSLTDSATSEGQIRFAQHRRANRSYVRIIDAINSMQSPLSVSIGNAAALDVPSREFFRVASTLGGWDLTYTDRLNDDPEVSVGPHEFEVLRALRDLAEPQNLDLVVESAFTYINAGDAWTGVALGRELTAAEHSPRVWNLLALGFAMLGEAECAEFYYDRWFDGGDDVDKVRALYGKSMLYSRHHRAGLRDLERSGELLQQANGIVESLPEERRADELVIFESVFNRNGYALVEFRRGNVEEAVGLLERGIERLAGTSEKVAIHRSVLIYNLAQCYYRLGELDAAVATYERLFIVDPYMPEYRLEAAKCFAASNRYAEAIESCRIAIDLDRALPTAWALLGLFQGDHGMYAEAADAYAEASRLEPERGSTRLNVVYYLLLAGEVDRAEQWLHGVVPQSIMAEQRDRLASMRAEVELRRGRVSRARAVLEAALRESPASEILRKNHDLLGAR